ncbi:MAG: hypothetical protein GX434_14420 [Peptococcaceae bacterium]|nr:hypothetical protein [Peptococcaceae bacterium]
MMNNMMGYNMMGAGACIGMFLYWAILIGVFFLVVVAIVKYIQGRKLTKNNEVVIDNKNSSDIALEELKIRFAKGEINKEEYIERKQFLQD